MDNSNKEMLDVKALFHYLLHNWYWFLIALVIFGCAAGCFYSSRPKVCTVAMTVQISPEEESVLLPGTGVLQTSNKAVNIGDEQAVFVSQDVLQKAIKEAKLNVTFYKKYHLRWLEECKDWSDLVVTWPEEAVANIYQPLRINVSVDKNAVEIKTKLGHKSSTHKVNSLAEPWTSPEGITIAARRELQAGSSYRLIFVPTNIEANYFNEVKIDYPRKSNTIIELTTTTQRPNKTMAIMANEVKVYNRITLAKRQETARQTIARIDERLAELTAQKSKAQNKETVDQLILLLMQRREDKVMALETSTPPAVIVSAPHITSETISPSLAMLAFAALILGLGLPFLVLYVLFVTREQK